MDIEQAVNVVKNRDEFRSDFAAWLVANWDIYKEFERQAFSVARIREYYAARTIVEYIRHNTALSEGGHFKINNNRIPDMARLFMELHPEMYGFFKLRDSDLRLGLEAA